MARLSGPGSIIGGPDCTPGYYNNEGQDPGAFLGRGYPSDPAPTSPTSTSGARPERSRGWSSGNVAVGSAGHVYEDFIGIAGGQAGALLDAGQSYLDLEDRPAAHVVRRRESKMTRPGPG